MFVCNIERAFLANQSQKSECRQNEQSARGKCDLIKEKAEAV